MLGKALFAPLFRDIAAGMYEKDLEKELDKLLPTNKKITEESVLIAKASLHAFAEGHELLPSVCACRMATYYYRGVALPRRTDEFAEDASLRVSFRWKTHAVEGKALEEFWLESVVNFRPKPAVVPVVCKNLCKAAAVARTSCKEKAEFEGELTSAVLKSLLVTKSYQLLQIDPEYGVELAILAAVSGDGSSERICESAFDLLPTEQNPKTPESVMVSLEKLVHSNAFCLACATGQSKVIYIYIYKTGRPPHRGHGARLQGGRFRPGSRRSGGAVPLLLVLPDEPHQGESQGLVVLRRRRRRVLPRCR